MGLVMLGRMTAVGLSLGLFFADASAAAAPAGSERDRNELRGPVESVLLEFQHAPRAGETLEYARDRIQFERYDREGTVVAMTVFNPDFVDELTIERLDAQTVVLSGHITVAETRHLTFDERGNVTEIAVYYGRGVQGELFVTYRYAYDAAGRKIEEDWYDSDGKRFAVIRFTRDGKGNITREESNFNDRPPPNAVRTYEYEFDSHGNWIKRIEAANDLDNGQPEIEPYGTSFRTITYYGEDASQPAPQ
jgi:hypothetical protein